MSTFTQKMVNAAPQVLKNTTVKLELSWGVIGMIIMLGTFYIAISGVGINTFNKCSKIQDSQKWENLKSYLSHTMTMVIASIATLILVKMFKSQVVVFAMVFGIMGIIASSMTLAMVRECKDSVNKSALVYAGTSLAVHLAMTLGIPLYKYFMASKPKLNKPVAQTTTTTTTQPFSQNMPINSMKME